MMLPRVWGRVDRFPARRTLRAGDHNLSLDALPPQEIATEGATRKRRVLGCPRVKSNDNVTEGVTVLSKENVTQGQPYPPCLEKENAS